MFGDKLETGMFGDKLEIGREKTKQGKKRRKLLISWRNKVYEDIIMI